MLYKYKSYDNTTFELEANRLGIIFEIHLEKEKMEKNKTYYGRVIYRDNSLQSPCIPERIKQGYMIAVGEEEIEYCKLKEQKIKLKDLI